MTTFASVLKDELALIELLTTQLYVPAKALVTFNVLKTVVPTDTPLGSMISIVPTILGTLLRHASVNVVPSITVTLGNCGSTNAEREEIFNG